MDLQGIMILRLRLRPPVDERGDFAMRPGEEPSAGDRIGERRIGGGALPQVGDGFVSIAKSVGLEGAAEIAGGIPRSLLGTFRCLPGNAPGPLLDHETAEDNRGQGGGDRAGERGIAPQPAAGMLSRREGSGERRPAVEEARQVDAELGGRLVAIARPFRQAFAADGDEIGVDPRHDAVGRLRLDIEHAPVDGVERQAGVDAAPRQESVEDEAEGMDVGPGIHRAERRVDLLGGHPLRRPQPRTDLGGGAAGGIVIDADDRGAQAEVTELHPLPSHSLRLPDGAARLGPVVGGERAVVARHEENVPRLDVAVDDAHGMGRVSRFGEGPGDTGGYRGIDGAGMTLEIGGEAFAAQLLGDVGELVVFPHLMNDDDMRMGNLRGVSRLAEESIRLPCVEEDLGAGDLQRLAADE